MKKSFVLISLLLLLFSFSGCNNNDFGTTGHLPVSSGKLSLENYDITNEPPLILNGEWEFYWNQLLSPADFKNNSSLQSSAIIQFPSYWNNLNIDGVEVEAHGYATYRLHVKNVPINRVLAVKMRNAMTSYKLWINNELLLENGKVGINNESSTPGFLPDVQSFIVRDSIINITLQISNFSHAKGGIRGDIILGETNKVNKIRELNSTLEMFLIGSILIMGLYHFGLFFLLRKDKSTLFFGILCLAVALRIACTGEIVINNYLRVPWEFLQKLEYITFVATLPSLLLFIRTLYPKQTSKLFVNGFVAIGIIFFVLILVTNSTIFSHIANPYQIVMVIGGIYMLYVLVKAIRQERDRLSESYIFLAGFGILFITVMYDVFYYNFLTQKGYLAPFGLVAFIFSQSFLLSKRFSVAFKMVELYSTSLERKVKERTLELEHKNENLEQLNKEKDSMVDIVAHDLKSPFNNILGFTELLNLEGKLNNAQKGYVDQIKKMVGAGRNLIRDILDMHAYDYEEFKIRNEKIDLAEFIEEWKNRYSQSLLNKGQKLFTTVPDEMYLVVDKELLTRILDNLMTNAIKFSDNGKRIWVSAQTVNDSVEVEVKDEGPGLTEEDQKLMFNRFQKLSAKPTAGESSNGLGLSIIKSLISKLGGEIRVISSKGEGASFSIVLPSNFDSIKS